MYTDRSTTIFLSRDRIGRTIVNQRHRLAVFRATQRDSIEYDKTICPSDVTYHTPLERTHETRLFHRKDDA